MLHSDHSLALTQTQPLLLRLRPNTRLLPDTLDQQHQEVVLLEVVVVVLLAHHTQEMVVHLSDHPPIVKLLYLDNSGQRT